MATCQLSRQRQVTPWSPDASSQTFPAKHKQRRLLLHVGQISYPLELSLVCHHSMTSWLQGLGHSETSTLALLLPGGFNDVHALG
jgi:hypothetical protein